MMLRTLTLAAIALAGASAGNAQSLPGVQDREARMTALPVTQIERGNGDVLFLRDSLDRWYRAALNEGCLRNTFRVDGVTPLQRVGAQPLERDTMVGVIGGGFSRPCSISSLRRSGTPPQVNSKSPVTLD